MLAAKLLAALGAAALTAATLTAAALAAAALAAAALAVATLAARSSDSGSSGSSSGSQQLWPALGTLRELPAGGWLQPTHVEAHLGSHLAPQIYRTWIPPNFKKHEGTVDPNDPQTDPNPPNPLRGQLKENPGPQASPGKNEYSKTHANANAYAWSHL